MIIHFLADNPKPEAWSSSYWTAATYGPSSNLDLVTATGTQITLNNLATDWYIELTGDNFTFDPVTGLPTGGTVTFVEFISGSGTPAAYWDGLSWSLVQAKQALESYMDSDPSQLAALLSSGPIVVDGSAATGVVHHMPPDLTWNVTSNVQFTGSAGDDYFILTPSVVSVTGGGGHDTINLSFAEFTSTKIDLRAGTVATVHGGVPGNFPVAGILDAIGSDGPDVVAGDRQDNLLFGILGADVIKGRGGNDKLKGGAGKDVLRGGAGNDRLVGQKGHDKLFGNAGADKFVFRGGDGHDVVKDFSEADNDHLLLNASLGVTSAADALAHATDNGTDIVFSFDTGDVLILQGLGGNGTAFLLDDITIWSHAGP